MMGQGSKVRVAKSLHMKLQYLHSSLAAWQGIVKRFASHQLLPLLRALLSETFLFTGLELSGLFERSNNYVINQYPLSLAHCINNDKAFLTIINNYSLGVSTPLKNISQSTIPNIYIYIQVEITSSYIIFKTISQSTIR